MQKIIFLLIPLLFLASCTTNENIDKDTSQLQSTQDNYYSNLKKECILLSDYEKGFCEKSVERMKQGGYKKSEKIDNKFICPEGMTLDGEKSIGSIWYCKPLSK